jgi:hypothetical protein
MLTLEQVLQKKLRIWGLQLEQQQKQVELSELLD